MVAGWDPEWLEFTKSMGPAPSLPDDPNEKRVMLNAMLIHANETLPPPPDDIITKNFEVPDGPNVRVYRPGGQTGALPMVLFIHGGGWFAGTIDTEDRTCRMVCSMISGWVVSVDYRCGFEYTLEQEVEDCYKAFIWAHGRAPAHGVDPKKCLVWGGSAGGALAIAVVHRLVREGIDVGGLICMNALTLHPDATPEKYKHLMTSYVDNDGFLPIVSGHDTLALYQQRNIEPPNTNIEVFPTAGGSDAVKGFPPTYIITSDNDASRDDGTVLEAALKDADVPVKRDNIIGLAHYFWTFDLPMANANFWSKLCSGMIWAMNQPRSKVNGH